MKMGLRLKINPRDLKAIKESLTSLEKLVRERRSDLLNIFFSQDIKRVMECVEALLKFVEKIEGWCK